MSRDHQQETAAFMERLKERNPGQPEFHQAVHEVVETLMPTYLGRQDLVEANILERIVEPDRTLLFRVAWEDDEGKVHVNKGYRVQFNGAIGPYKGGLRFHPSVRLGTLKFLGFEQIFKNSLTGLPMGGAKGGSDFDPKGRSQPEVLRFCQAFMSELARHIGPAVDVPAGDIGVGTREVGYLFGQYRRMTGQFVGAVTGKAPSLGGSAIRQEATGYGCAYFMKEMLAHVDEDLEGRAAAVSGSGNVALHLIEKLSALGARVVTASDSDGFVHDPEGIQGERLEWLKELKQVRRGRIREYAEEFGCDFHEGAKPWGVEAELAFPCATQNEVDGDDAEQMIANGLRALAEGANMPLRPEAVAWMKEAGVLYAPGKASNAGGVAVSGLERTQNFTALPWEGERVDERLQAIMRRIHATCVGESRHQGDVVDYAQGADIGGFRKVADAMVAAGPT